MHSSFTISTIAIAHTPYQQKFAIPRQAGLLDIPAQIELLEPYNQISAVKGMEKLSHIWLSFIFHQHLAHKPQLQVRPPRLGGNEKIGVFATRSSFRPNNIGQSVVKLERIEQRGDQLLLHVLGLDVVDGTPIIDIKPYLPYADRIENAINTIADTRPKKTVTVVWQQQAIEQLQQLQTGQFTNLHRWISDLIAYDPRPAYRNADYGDNERYVMRFYHMDIHWLIAQSKEALITAIQRV